MYYGPITLAGWHFGRKGAFVAAGLCTAGWFSANRLAGLEFSHTAVWVANTILQGASFTVVGWLVASLRATAIRERALSRTDPLCQLLNGRGFADDSERLLALCRRGHRPVTLAYLDLDDFKAVNDVLGHKAGDALLNGVAHVLRSSVRASDLAARLGGDEFAILLSEIGPGEARQALERLRATIAEQLSSDSRKVTASIGAVTFMTAPADVQTMIPVADAAMYAAKRDGKNRVRVDVIT